MTSTAIATDTPSSYANILDQELEGLSPDRQIAILRATYSDAQFSKYITPDQGLVNEIRVRLEEAGAYIPTTQTPPITSIEPATKIKHTSTLQELVAYLQDCSREYTRSISFQDTVKRISRLAHALRKPGAIIEALQIRLPKLQEEVLLETLELLLKAPTPANIDIRLTALRHTSTPHLQENLARYISLYGTSDQLDQLSRIQNLHPDIKATIEDILETVERILHHNPEHA